MEFIYSIYDKVSEKWAPLFQAVNDASAVRLFRRAVMNDPYAYDDMELYRVGSVNMETAFVEGCQKEKIHVEREN